MPDDVDKFKQHYVNVHIPLFKKIPNILRTRYSFNPVTLGGDGEYFCILEAEFADEERLKRALESEQARIASEDVPNYSPKPPTIITMSMIEV